MVVGVRLASLHTRQLQWINLIASSLVQLSKCPLFILITENKGGPTHVLKQRIYFTQWKCELPGFTILGKDASG